MSLLFQPHRVIGLVVGPQGFEIQRLGQDTFVTVNVGQGFQVLDQNLRTRLVSSKGLPSDSVRAVAILNDVTFTAVGRKIVVWKRMHVMGILTGAHTRDVSLLYIFGNMLMSVDEAQTVNVWDLSPLKAHKKAHVQDVNKLLQQEQDDKMQEDDGSSSDSDSDEQDDNVLMKKHSSQQSLLDWATLPLHVHTRAVTCILHPATLLNKVLIGFDDGSLELWNIRTGKCIYVFQMTLDEPSNKALTGQFGAVTVISQSTIVKVVGVGFDDGTILILNVETDRVMQRYRQSEGSVTSLAFRTDGPPMMASAGSTGDIAVWQLEKRTLLTVLRGAHEKAVTKLAWLDSQPLLLSSGQDNALKMWIFDNADGSGRLLRQRSGHSAPPVMARFHSNDNTTVLSAGLDGAFRYLSTIRDTHSAELSQGHLGKTARKRQVRMDSLRLSQMQTFAVSPARRDWPTIVSAHSQEAAAYVWNYENKAMSQTKLMNPDRKPSDVACVCVSMCGHYAIVGSVDGFVEKFNLQSGFFRGAFPPLKMSTQEKLLNRQVKRRRLEMGEKKEVEAQLKQEENLHTEESSTEEEFLAHVGGVAGVAADGGNRLVVTAGRVDGLIKLWSFTSRKLLHEMNVGQNIDRLVYNRDSDLFAIVTDDLVVRLYSTQLRKVVRIFRGHYSRISDLCFSPDGKWLVSACMDSSVRVFELLTGRLIDWFAFDNAVTSLSFSPESDMLLTTHADKLGVFLWINRAHFTNVFFKQPPEEPANVDLPEMSEHRATRSISGLLGNVEMRKATREEFGLPEPLDAQLLTMSNIPRSTWTTLAHMELVKQRNKPTEAPTQSEPAPFFLPSMLAEANASDAKMQDDTVVEETTVQASSRVLQNGSNDLYARSKFVAALEAMNDDPDVITNVLRTLRPAAIDADVRALGLDVQHEEHELGLMLRYLRLALAQTTHYELVQATLHLFLSVHGETIAKNSTLTHMLRSIDVQTNWHRLEDLLQYNSCMLDFFLGAK